MLSDVMRVSACAGWLLGLLGSGVPALAAEPVSSLPGAVAPLREPAKPAPKLLLAGPGGPKIAGAAAAQPTAAVRLPALDVARLLAEDRVRAAQPGTPLRVGVNRALPAGPVDPATAGTWTTLADGTAVWSLVLEAPGATGLRVHFAHLALPEGARVVVAGGSGEEAQAYSGKGPAGKGFFWAAAVPGTVVRIEYQDPNGGPVRPLLEIDQVSHLYAAAAVLGLPEASEEAALLPCHEDVNCHVVDQTAKTAVARILYVKPEGTFACTGTLLNDADPNTFAGYFLTANHCLSSQDVVDTLQIRWFFETMSCSGALQNGFNTFGGTLLATSPVSDFTFLRLANDPSGGQGFAGWNAAFPIGAVAGIHHPGASYKRVSFGTLTEAEPICDDVPLDRFVYLDWTMGMTEPGSSGSPLFNDSWQVVGQNFGKCQTVVEVFCETDPERYNVLYGRFDLSFPSISSWLNLVTPDDAFEDNDDLAQAPLVDPGEYNLRLLDFDDYFRVRVCAADVVTATATFDSTEMDLDLLLLASDGSVLSSSNGTGDSETVSAAVAAGDYYVRAIKDGGWGGDYTLTISLGNESDCNLNGVIDPCDILDETSTDVDADGIPDECAQVPLPAEPPHDIRKNRFISINPNNPSSPVVLKVELLHLTCEDTGQACASASDCKQCVGGTSEGAACTINSDCTGGGSCTVSDEVCIEQSPPVPLGWVGDPFDPGTDHTPPGTMTALVVNAMPAFRLWTENPVHVGDCEIAPVQVYGIRASKDAVLFSEPLVVGTIVKPSGKFWADVVGSFDGSTWTAPNFLVNVDDVVAWVKFATLKPAPHITVLDLGGEVPNFQINATDLQLILAGFSNKPYPPPSFVDNPTGDPSNCP